MAKALLDNSSLFTVFMLSTQGGLHPPYPNANAPDTREDLLQKAPERPVVSTLLHQPGTFCVGLWCTFAKRSFLGTGAVYGSGGSARK
jgi:hypothetical protein